MALRRKTRGMNKSKENTTTPKVYTLVIKASKGGDTTTRALREGTNYWGENTVEFNWSGDETFEVLQNNVKIGTATPVIGSLNK